MSSQSGFVCPECGLKAVPSALDSAQPPVEPRRFGDRPSVAVPSSHGTLCESCDIDAKVLEAIKVWTENTSVGEALSVHGTRLVRCLAYPLLPALLHRLKTVHES